MSKEQMKEQMKATTPKYEYVDSPVNPEVGAIKILEGDFEGLVYQYGKAAFNERDDGQCELNFQFTAFDKPEDIDLKSDELYNVMGNILVEVLEEHLENTEGLADAAVSVEDVDESQNPSITEAVKATVAEVEKHRNENG